MTREKSPRPRIPPDPAPPRPTAWAALLVAGAASGLWLAGLGLWRLAQLVIGADGP
ncbi:hypothetical protein [Pontitalea aquivivens]|uniref:hypothetical protein n=1 Tax=Pontitalea aquivivens TaxID=3388663 RepID=UPI0039707163